MGHLISHLKTFFPIVAIITGLAGSLHCVGMCGGLVTASCHNHKDIFRYQIGRLLGYLLLGVIAGWLGSYFKDLINHPIFSYLPSFFVGGIFILWGLEIFFEKKFFTRSTKALGTSYQLLWNKLVHHNISITRSFFTGLISILLPCGLLYGVILGAFATQDMLTAFLSIIFFWVGTLPAMLIAPSLFKKLLSPFKANRPKIYALALVLIGLMTIGYRLYNKADDNSCNCHTTKGKSL